MNSLAKREKQILAGLKDFQRATVERVFSLFVDGNNRVLVADEVGLGKTLIAKGVIAKTALYHQAVLKDDLFKVVYVCSNQSIAGQNLSKLSINETDRIERLADTRLSMQHLKIYEDEALAAERNNYIQLIPLTPATSFSMTGGGGSVQERALIYAILRRYKGFATSLKGLEILLADNAVQSWNSWAKDYYEKRVCDCDQASGDRKYLATILNRIYNYFALTDGLLEEVVDICALIESTGTRADGSYPVILKLRRMMAEISVDLLDADLVIMDEFQRFPELIRTDTDDETALLARRFFNADKRDNEKIKILLLSATPYKLYSTQEEIYETRSDEHYREFMQLTDFLFESDRDKSTAFKQVWRNYSVSLSEIGTSDFTILTARKKEAEDALYQGICRTERLAIEGADKFVDIQTATNPLDISEDDIVSFAAANSLLASIGLTESVPIDYIKSAPFILSFMEHYKLKDKVFKYFKNNPDQLSLARKRELWIDESLLERYEELPDTNARMKRLKEEAFPQQAERLIWVPPCKPYYESGGIYAKAKQFSKVLVFSAWEMVPRAIAATISYEAERLTIGEFAKRSANLETENRGYFPKKGKVRFPIPRLKINMRDGEPASMNMMCLLYPSVTLAGIYDPISAMNAGMTRKQIEADLRSQIEALLEKISFIPKADNTSYDESWYSVAPILFDKDEPSIMEWLEKSQNIWDYDQEQQDDESNEDPTALQKHFNELRSILREEKLVLGRKPRDLVDVLVKMAMASPAVCAMRLFGTETTNSQALSLRLAKTIVNRFNLQESTAIVELCYQSNDPHWKKVLHYCTDGNFQAMLDEYAHIITDDNGLQYLEQDTKSAIICDRMNEAFNVHTASYNVDTYQKFRDRITKGEKHKIGQEKGERRFIKMRSGYAAGFYDIKASDKSLQRKESLRLAFNSPFRPFVLATTSIGQEGLDFHFYCRKIMHWNLPSNPIDLEQREGRINRYKCLAIRQNIAQRYRGIEFKKDVWNEMFNMANLVERKDTFCELVPFWCLSDATDVKIERIVPMYPYSRDQAKYKRLIKILSLYRLSLGQARQDELLEYVMQSDLDEKQIKELFINLSPYYKERIDAK